MLYGWSPSIGDPTVYGWLTVFFYFVAAAISYCNWHANRLPTRPGTNALFRSRARRRFWIVTGFVLLGLGINKQLDLQTLLTDIGRATAREQGWYDARQGVQRQFISAVAVIALVCGATLPVLARRAGRWEMAATIGLVSLFAFVGIRAASFHHIDAVLSSTWAGAKINHVMELGGIAVIALTALGRKAQDRRRCHPKRWGRVLQT